MPTLLITHPVFVKHDTGFGHPERPDRLRAIEQALEDESFQFLHREEAPLADEEAIARMHGPDYIAALKKAAPASGHIYVDGGDTVMSPDSWEAALRAAGAAVTAVDQVMSGAVRNAFCVVRPPGHHAETRQAMGFCLFNNVAIAAAHARAVHGMDRVAVVDFDVHHGNGTQHMFWSDADMFYGSTHQMPLFPGTGAWSEQGVAGNIVNAPLRAGDDSYHFQEAFESRILPALHDFSPDLVIISAGFDAHRADPIGGLALTEEDFAWATRRLSDVANQHAGGRLVSVLEGGYDLGGLARSVAAHLRVLMEYSA
ncbi:MAG: histone deacetylase family protein, partial [Dichotomicrobium sp.]